jgi:uncharacterized membrane protein YczE
MSRVKVRKSLFRTISTHFGWKLPKVKVLGDTTMVAISALISLFLAHDLLLAIGIGTVFSMLLTGRFVGWFQKALPFLTVDPPVKEPEPAPETEEEPETTG